MAKIFITGGFGYLGSHLAREAVKAGHEVLLYDSLVYEQDYEKIQKEIGDSIRCIGDTRNTGLLIANLTEFNPDFVVHFGEFGSVYACNHNPRLTVDNNLDATIEVLRICEEMGFKVLYNSSSSVYGTQKGSKLMKEDDPVPHPTDNYVRSKLLVEEYIEQRPGLDIIVFRPATVFGLSPRLRIDLMPNHFTYMALAKKEIKVFDGNAYRAGIDIDELTKAYLKVIAKGSWNYRLYNIGHHNMTKLEFAEGIQKVVPCKIGDSSDITDPRSLQIDCTRFNKEFDFKPRTSYRESIRKIAKWISINQKELESNNFNEVLTMPLSEWQRMCN